MHAVLPKNRAWGRIEAEYMYSTYKIVRVKQRQHPSPQRLRLPTSFVIKNFESSCVNSAPNKHNLYFYNSSMLHDCVCCNENSFISNLKNSAGVSSGKPALTTLIGSRPGSLPLISARCPVSVALWIAAALSGGRPIRGMMEDRGMQKEYSVYQCIYTVFFWVLLASFQEI